MRRFHSLMFVAAVLVTGAFAAQSALADDTDPAIQLSSSSTGTGLSETYSWSYVANVTDGTVMFLNDSGEIWTSLDIVADYSTNGHTFTCRVSGGVFDQTACTAGATSGSTAEFGYSGGTGVADGSYLGFQWINWNTNSGSTLPITFNFTANGGGPTAAPEPSSIAMLGIGLFGLIGFVGLAKFRKSGITLA